MVLESLLNTLLCFNTLLKHIVCNLSLQKFSLGICRKSQLLQMQCAINLIMVTFASTFLTFMFKENILDFTEISFRKMLDFLMEKRGQDH